MLVGMLMQLHSTALGRSVTDIAELMSVVETPRSYYVAPSGNDANEGTIDYPVLTINAALSKANPGDTVFVRNGTYSEKISFPKSGRTGKYITLQAYPGENPIIDGTGQSIIGKEALVTISHVSYILFEGFDICNYKSTIPWVNINGILVTNGSRNISVRNNKIYNIEHNVAPEDGRSGHGIEIIGNTSVVMTNILIEGNEIHDCNTGYSENLTINGNVSGFEIRNNKIYNGENIGIDAAGGYSANPNPAYNYARKGVIADNEVYNINGSSGPIPAYSEHDGAIGIYVDGARSIIVERNKVYDCGRGIGLVSETDNFPTQDCIVRNNFVFNCSLSGISIGGYIGYTTGGTNNCYVVNNTLFQNNRDLGYFNEVEGEIRLAENCNNDTILNNVIYVRKNNNVFVHKYTTTGSNNRIDYNLYYSDGLPRWIWNGKVYTFFSAWKKACQDDAHSTYDINPLFVNTTNPDLHLQSSSPAVESGLVLSTDICGTTDIDGNPRITNNKISKGAHALNPDDVNVPEEFVSACSILVNNGFLRVETTEAVTSIEVYSTNGTLVGHADDDPIYVGHLPKGIYIICIHTTIGMNYKKILL